MRIVVTFLLNAGLNFAVGLAIAAVLGPSDYGRFAVGATAGAVIATGVFDWLRLSTARFYGETQRTSQPALRATLDAAFLGLAASLVGLAVVVPQLPIGLGLSLGFVAAVVLTAIANGAFDFQAALARARFKSGQYGLLVVGRGILGLVFALGAALLGAAPPVILAAQAVGTLLAIVPVYGHLSDRPCPGATAEAALIRRFACYGVPIVVANVVFQGILLMNRSATAATFGYAAAGNLSLATDIMLRLLLAVGAAIDVLVFQLAVRSEMSGGRRAAERQIQANMIVIGAILIPLAIGSAVTMPAFATLAVPARFRGDFVPLASAVLPGIFLFCLGQFALNPVFQIAHRTAPIIGGALVSAVVDGAGLLLLPKQFGPMSIAVVHSSSLAAGFLVLACMALRDQAVRPSAKDCLGLLLAGAVMVSVLWPTRAIAAPVLSLLVAGIIGVPSFAATLVILDVGQSRGLVRAWGSRLLGRTIHEIA